MQDERSQEERQQELEQLAAELTLDPDSPVFARLAEAYRSAGLAADAHRVAQHGLERHPDLLSGRMALGLSLLDLDRIDEAREVFAEVLGTIEAADRSEVDSASAETGAAAVEAFSAGPSSQEIDSAFDLAETQRDQMRDAVTVAHEAMRAENLDQPEIGSAPHEEADLELEPLEVVEAPATPCGMDEASEEASAPAAVAGFSATDYPTFATAAMAELLEEQGDTANAEEIRASLGEDPEEPSAAAEDLASESMSWPEEPAAESWPEPSSLVEEPFSLVEEPEPVSELEPAPLDAAEVPEDIVQSAPANASRHARVLTTLELWLRNIRREMR